MSMSVNGAVVRQERKARKLTQVQLSEKADVGVSTIARAERGEALLIKQIRAIALAFCQQPVRINSPDVERKPTLGGLLTRITNTLDHAQEQPSPVSSGKNTAPKVQARAGYKLLKLAQLEGLQDEVMAPNFVLSEAMLSHLLAAQDECRTAEPESGHYASLILGYALLKAGPEKTQFHRYELNSLVRVAEKDLPVSMAAKWIAGRAHLVWASQAKTLENKLRETEAAYRMFLGIQALSENELSMPILLPGAQQEYDAEELHKIGWTSENDPLIRRVKKPARYIAATALALAGDNPFDPKDHRGEAICKSIEISKHSATDAPVWLNAKLLELDAKAIRSYFSPGREGRKEVLAGAHDLNNRISRSGNNVSRAKKSEWLANCDACRALAIIGGKEGADSIQQLRAALKDLVQLIERVPDFIKIDPVYQIAFDSQDGISFDEAVSDLHWELVKRDPA